MMLIPSIDTTQACHGRNGGEKKWEKPYPNLNLMELEKAIAFGRGFMEIIRGKMLVQGEESEILPEKMKIKGEREKNTK